MAHKVIGMLKPYLACLEGVFRIHSSRSLNRCFSSTSLLDDEADKLLQDKEYEQVFPRRYRPSGPGAGHHLLLIQPRIHWRPQRGVKGNKDIESDLLTPEIRQDEAVALVDTLNNWSVVDKMIVNCQNPTTQYVFGTGNVITIGQRIQSNPKISAVFIGKDVLSGAQQSSLEEVWKVPVLDRYSLVLQIFSQHAKTKEAKLQVALAEIPYIRGRLREMHENKEKSPALGSIGGQGESYFHQRKRLLNERHRNLMKQVEKVRIQREILRQNRKRHNIPTVAVVGYTNCGKTTLIKALSRDDGMPDGQNKLFATLDVTVHATRLPGSGQMVLMADTIGFISDIPTGLIEAFMAVMEEIKLSDLIIHVMDLSNPTFAMQRETVLQTLASLKVSSKLSQSMIHVGNKVDCLTGENVPEFDGIKISAQRGDGLVELLQLIESGIKENTGQKRVRLRVLSGREEMNWLIKKKVGIESMEADPQDVNYMLMTVLFTPANHGRYTKEFGTSSFIKDDDNDNGNV